MRVGYDITGTRQNGSKILQRRIMPFFGLKDKSLRRFE